jgi:hypothetical protein
MQRLFHTLATTLDSSIAPLIETVRAAAHPLTGASRGFLHIPPKRCIRLLPASAQSGAGLTLPRSDPDRSGQGFW